MIKHNNKVKSFLAYMRGFEFANAAELLDQNEVALLVPHIVNLAFSCELLLKSLIFKEQQQDMQFREHKLSELFSMLEPSTQSIIKHNSNIQDWDSFMKESSNAFVEWRYLHEAGKYIQINVRDMKQLYSALKNYCEATYQYKYPFVDEENVWHD